MLKYSLTRFFLAGLLAAGAVFGTAYGLKAREPQESVPTSRIEEKVTMHSGLVEKLLKNDRGHVDGLVFEDGFEVHFPPHVGRKVVELIKVGDKADVHGRQETRPRGEVVFEAVRIDSQGQTLTVDRPQPPHGPKGKAKGKSEKPMNASGAVKAFATNPHGAIDGLILDDDTVVKFPPHLGDALQELVDVGDKVQIEGRRHETPHGDLHLHADRVVAVASGKSLNRHGPGERSPAPPAAASKSRGQTPEPTNAEILRELSEIRRLLESRKP